MCVHHSCYVYRGCTGDVGVGRPARCRSGWAFAAKVPGLLEACRSARLLSTWALLECCRALPFLMSLCPFCHALMFWFWHPIIFSRERGIACHLSQFKVVISKDFCLREEMQAWAARWTQMDGEMLWHRTAGPACPWLKRKNRCEGSCEPKINYMYLSGCPHTWWLKVDAFLFSGVHDASCPGLPFCWLLNGQVSVEQEPKFHEVESHS